ncbi:MAG: hypothetical protein AAF715_19555 [Myxococcota bacterium]
MTPTVATRARLAMPPAVGDTPRAMNDVQGNTPPPWRGRSEWSLWRACLGGVRQNRDKLEQVAGTFEAFLNPALVRDRLARLRDLGHCDHVPSVPQLLVASQHQLSFSLGAETKLFYQAQGIGWVGHNVKRFVAYPTTMMDPVGLFVPRDSIIQHVLQTFHRHATYDLVLVRAHEGGLEEMKRQLDQLAAGTHPHQASLEALVEDGSYHDRLRRDVAEFIANPHVVPRPIPDGLVDDPRLMLAMDQFKDLRGYVDYAHRLDVGPMDAAAAFGALAVNETVGDALGLHVGPRTLRVDCCDPELVARHLGPDDAPPPQRVGPKV